MQQGNGSAGSGRVATATLTDEQILDMELVPEDESGGAGEGTARAVRRAATDGSSDTARAARRAATDAVGDWARRMIDGKTGGAAERGALTETADAVSSSAAAAADAAEEALRDVTNSSERSDSSTDAEPKGAASGESSSESGGEPAWLAALDAQPAAAAEARRWQASAKDVAALDAAYFSADSGARAGLAERLYASDPAAFREMLAASARTLAARDPEGLADLARQLGAPAAETRQAGGKSVSQVARPVTGGVNGTHSSIETRADATANGAENSTSYNSGHNSGRDAGRDAGTDSTSATGTHGGFPAEAYRTFEAATNDDVARKMHEAIDRSLTSALPEGVAAGARRRIGEDIFREVHAALSGDRELSRRVGDTLRDWRFDASARQQVVALVAGRARAVLPEVARRVVAEWTSSVLASDRAKTARIDAAASRRDITGGRLPEPVAGNMPRSRDLDYRRLSDEEILGM